MVENRESNSAGWASWRQIRESETGAVQPDWAPQGQGENQSAPGSQPAARAVAAGAEESPVEASRGSASDPASIASIVDSVLADLRPKIVEEISKQLRKK